MAPVRSGQILFEVIAISEEHAFFVLRKAATKSPIKVTIIKSRY